MTDDEQTERRLHAMLHGRADQVDSQLTGPELRRRATRGAAIAGRARRLAPVLAAAAAVAVIATVTAVIGSDDPQHGPAPVQPGGQTTATATTPAPLPSTSPAIRTTAVPRRPTLLPPAVSSSARATTTPTPTSRSTSLPTKPTPSYVPPQRGTSSPSG